MKMLLFSVLLISQVVSARETCPSGHTCMKNPTYEGYEFLANTASELVYARYANYASYPAELRKERAQRVCKFLGHNKATFATYRMTWDDLLVVDRKGFADIVEASYPSPNAAFEKLNCR